jgi:hypothetical protein
MRTLHDLILWSGARGSRRPDGARRIGHVCWPLRGRAAGKKGGLLLDALGHARTPIVRRLGKERAGIVAFGRFLANPRVTMNEIFAGSGMACGARAAGREVLAIQDTTHLAFAGRPLGPGGDGEVPGLFLHPVLVLDTHDGTALGLAAGRVWTRPAEKQAHRHSRALADKESERWIGEGRAAKVALAGASHVTLIADRESDIYEQWATLPGPGFDLITRARGDRRLADGGSLFCAARAWTGTACVKIDLVAREDRTARTAKLVVGFGPVAIKKPASCRTAGMPEQIDLRLVEIVETDAPPGVEPIHWRLLTTLAVDSIQDALGIIDTYRQRWRIEEYFRILKRSGMDLEEARTEGAHALHNLVAMAAVAGVPVMQLVEGRDAGPEVPATQVIGPETLAFAIALCASLQGRTAKQKNPHAEGSLAWLAWIVARLGGHTGYQREGPAGPKTMAIGWTSFITMQRGWSLQNV